MPLRNDETVLEVRIVARGTGAGEMPQVTFNTANTFADERRGFGLRGAVAWTCALVAALILAACADNNSKLTDTTRVPQSGPVTVAPVTRTDLETLPQAQTQSTQAALPPSGPAGVGKPTKIALLLPLGGFDQTAAVAKGMKQAAEMALFEAEQPNIQLIVKDDKGTADGARAAADEAIREGVKVILGPLLGRAVAGAAQAATPAGVPVLSFSNDTTVAAAGVYVLGFLPQQDVDRIIGFAIAKGKKRIAALLPDDGYGQVVGAAFRTAVAREGGLVAAVETYPAGANAMLGPSRRIVEAIKTSEAAGLPIDAVFVPGGQDVLPQLGPLLTYSGFDNGKVKLLGSGAWEFSNIASNEAFVGGWYPGPDPQGWRAFAAKFSKAYAQPPPRLASVAYDAVKIAIQLSAAPEPRFSTPSLTGPGGFAGVDGILKFRADGLTERALAVLEVQKIGSTVIDGAPSAFNGPLVSAAPANSAN